MIVCGLDDISCLSLKGCQFCVCLYVLNRCVTGWGIIIRLLYFTLCLSHYACLMVYLFYFDYA